MIQTEEILRKMSQRWRRRRRRCSPQFITRVRETNGIEDTMSLILRGRYENLVLTELRAASFSLSEQMSRVNRLDPCTSVVSRHKLYSICRCVRLGHLLRWRVKFKITSPENTNVAHYNSVRAFSIRLTRWTTFVFFFSISFI